MKTTEVRVIPTLIVFALSGLVAFYFPTPQSSAFTQAANPSSNHSIL